MNLKNIINFFFELGQLRILPRSGWRLLQKPQPESIAAHNLRAAQIGYILAHLEKYENPERVAAIMVFHEIGECRIGDIDKVMQRYVTQDEKQAVVDQTRSLEDVGRQIFSLWNEIEHQPRSPAGVIAKDADYLELIVTAKEYLEQGFSYAQDWIDNASGALKTKSAKLLVRELMKTHSNEWWQGLKKHK